MVLVGLAGVGIVVFMGFVHGFACCLIVCFLLWALVWCRFLAWVGCNLSLGLWFDIAVVWT